MNKKQEALVDVYTLDETERWKDEVNRLVGPVAQIALALTRRGYDLIHRFEVDNVAILSFRAQQHTGRNINLDIKHIGESIGYICIDWKKWDESPRGAAFTDCSCYWVKYRKL